MYKRIIVIQSAVEIYATKKTGSYARFFVVFGCVE